MLKSMIQRLQRFRAETEGSVTIEAVLILPMLFWIYLSLFSIFDAFRQYSINQKAAYTISDLVSRETNPINDSYLDNMRELLAYMTSSDGDEAKIRITLIRYDGRRDIYKRDWSRKRGNVPELRNNDVKNWHDKLPVMLNNERIIVVETWNDYDPPFNTGLEERTIRNFVFTRPRYAPQIVWENPA